MLEFIDGSWCTGYKKLNYCQVGEPTPMADCTTFTYAETIFIDISCCDKCGRSLDGKGYVENLGMKICGVCDYEIRNG